GVRDRDAITNAGENEIQNGPVTPTVIGERRKYEVQVGFRHCERRRRTAAAPRRLRVALCVQSRPTSRFPVNISNAPAVFFNCRICSLPSNAYKPEFPMCSFGCGFPLF